jgi:hypothetical protein
MNIIHTILETAIGIYFVVAEHDKKKISTLRVYQIVDGIVGARLSYTEKELPQLVENLEEALQ